MAETPHVFFAGNQPTFDAKTIKRDNKQILLLSVPAFVSSPVFVLVNLRTLEAHPISVGATIN